MTFRASALSLDCMVRVLAAVGCAQALMACWLQVALQNFPANDSEHSGRAASVPSQRVALQHQVRSRPLQMPVHAAESGVHDAWCLVQPVTG